MAEEFNVCVLMVGSCNSPWKGEEMVEMMVKEGCADEKTLDESSPI